MPFLVLFVLFGWSHDSQSMLNLHHDFQIPEPTKTVAPPRVHQGGGTFQRLPRRWHLPESTKTVAPPHPTPRLPTVCLGIAA